MEYKNTKTAIVFDEWPEKKLNDALGFTFLIIWFIVVSLQGRSRWKVNLKDSVISLFTVKRTARNNSKIIACFGPIFFKIKIKRNIKKGIQLDCFVINNQKGSKLSEPKLFK